MVDVGTTYYQIVIEDLGGKNKWYHTGGNIAINPPTLHMGLAKVYYSKSGADRAKKVIESKIGNNLRVRIMKFHPNTDI